MAKEKELARLEVRAVDCAEGVSYASSIEGKGDYILKGLAGLINAFADDSGVSSAFVLEILARECEVWRKLRHSWTIGVDLGAVERARGRDDG